MNDRQTRPKKNNEPLTAPKKNGGGSANINSCAFNKHGAFRQFSASNPPLLLAAKRYRSCWDDNRLLTIKKFK